MVSLSSACRQVLAKVRRRVRPLRPWLVPADPDAVTVAEAQRLVRLHEPAVERACEGYVVEAHDGPPPRSRIFIDSDLVHEAIRARNRRRVEMTPLFRLKQWLQAEALLRRRWPSQATGMVPGHLVRALRGLTPVRY